MLPAIILFAATYVLMLTFSKYRPYIALTSGVIFILSGMLPVSDIIGSLDFNVLLMIGGKNLPNGGWSMVGIALVIVFLVRLSSAMFGISGLRWFRRCGKLSRSGAVAWSAVQLIPCVDVIGAILCCIRLRRETLPAE